MGVGFGDTGVVHKALLMATYTFMTCRLLLQSETQCSAAEKIWIDLRFLYRFGGSSCGVVLWRFVKHPALVVMHTFSSRMDTLWQF